MRVQGASGFVSWTFLILGIFLAVYYRLPVVTQQPSAGFVTVMASINRSTLDRQVNESVVGTYYVYGLYVDGLTIVYLGLIDH